MPTTTIGQMVWFMTWDDRQGPFPAVVIRGGPEPLMSVFFAEGAQQLSATHWLLDDGSMTGWIERPVDGVVPPDLFD